MSTFSFRRIVAAAAIAIVSTTMLVTSFDAEARRMGGGSSAGRQSTNVMQNRQATTPPATPRANAAAAPAAGAAAGTAAAAGARSGASRWLGPIAGIAAGLGIAALLSSFGLGGAFLEFLSSAILVALVVFAVIFLVRRLRGGGARPATQGAYGGNAARQDNRDSESKPMWRETLKPAPAAPVAAAAAAPMAATAASTTGSGKQTDANGDWFIPGDFDTPRFLAQAKEQFIRIQGIWDSGNTDELRDVLTDDLIAELKPQLLERQGTNKTEVVLLNAELLGIETVSDGNLASVRFSGMLREDPGAEAFRFEEVWNLYKPAQGGWLLAGIQQIPVEYAS
ncbi:TIM44-like domain-containing protein [Alcaligenaceae bacterium A4P071]|nr:TIM44-like domain-containing protein [Alcaligenaceae bacterium A4P071]